MSLQKELDMLFFKEYECVHPIQNINTGKYNNCNYDTISTNDGKDLNSGLDGTTYSSFLQNLKLYSTYLPTHVIIMLYCRFCKKSTKKLPYAM